MCLARTTPALPPARWKELDAKAKDLTGPLHFKISHHEIPTDEAADELGKILSLFLKSEPEFQEVEKAFYQKQTKSLEEARIMKREMKKKARRRDATPEDKSNWLRAVKLYAFLLKKNKEKEGAGEVRKQEKAYKKNFFKFSKEACNGTLGEEKVQPSFTREEANTYYQVKYGSRVDVDTSKLDWYLPTQPPTIRFDHSEVRPCQVKEILKGKSPNTAPGEDGVLYGVLARLPSIHHILATLFTKTNQSSLAPASWSSSLVVLAHKDGDTKDPAMFRMIALTSTMGKLYHQVKAERMAKFMRANNYIDETTQKAFLAGVNGCIEHIQVIQEIIQDAKHRRRTVHFSWFDLSDAYGSIPHNLIEFSLRHYKVPDSEIKYIMNLYAKLRGKVVTKEWTSDTFDFRKGIFTGDNYSPIIFNTVFQPLIDFIKAKKGEQGYNLGDKRVITKPFADDFELISNDKRQHQKLQDEIQMKATSMGLTFKPSKCRSLSMEGGKPKPVVFTLADPGNGEKVELKTLEADPHKFLGCTMTYNNTPQDHLNFLKDKLTSKLKNIDATKVRGEFKMAVYTRYALPSMRYHLTVHNLHKTHLEELDLAAQVYLKKWLGIPAKGATSAGIFSPMLLGVKPVSQVYLEGHLGAYINTKLVADEDTREALKSAEEREAAWTKKSSTIIQCKEIFTEMKEEENCRIPTPDNCATYAITVRVEKPLIMQEAKRKVERMYRERSIETASQLSLQGEMLNLMAEEEKDVAWKVTIYQVPRGVMAWAVRASTNTLATPDNLARWGRPVETKCNLEGCSATCTLGHLLSSCKVALDRFKFRHDSVLNHLLQTIIKNKSDQVTVFADLNGWRTNGGTIPQDMVLTEQIPDLVIIDKSVTPTKVVLLELTVPWDSSNNFKAALDRKTARYERLCEDLRDKGYNTMNLPFEVGCRGVINARNHLVLEDICNLVRIRARKKLIGSLGRIALLGSYRIWLARYSQEWSGGELIR